jgi:hypothetical protein
MQNCGCGCSSEPLAVIQQSDPSGPRAESRLAPSAVEACPERSRGGGTESSPTDGVKKATCGCLPESGTPLSPGPDSRTVRKTTADLCFCDTLGRWKVRWGIGRMNYRVDPGLYRLADPDGKSPVIVTANYRMTFDLLRRELKGVDAWILVLDTKGINVWCAAGKGTFGTEELVRRIRNVRLEEFVNHRTLILPQLGAPGVAAHLVKKETGFRLVYGPVYAKDIQRFLADGLKITDPEMRRVRFTLMDRLVLTPMEIIPALKWIPLVFGILVLLRLPDGSGLKAGFRSELAVYLGALAIGTTLFQILLPWIPGRSFTWKGWLLGAVWTVGAVIAFRMEIWTAVSSLLIAPMLTGFIALNFTGATTFTSLSGVKKEMKFAVPALIGSTALGIVMRVISLFLT